jgi:hypothetical protein
LRTRSGVALWTDDFSNIFSVFLWSVPRMPGSKVEKPHRAPGKGALQFRSFSSKR